MGPDVQLPLPEGYSDVDAYVDSLLGFATTNVLFQTLCGGVHLLDFFTTTPDYYSTVLPESWRTWFQTQDIYDILDLILREDLTSLRSLQSWRGGPAPPEDFVEYVHDIRSRLLKRDFRQYSSYSSGNPKLARHVAVGMNVKKVHEVSYFARYVDQLTTDITGNTEHRITHLVDFGSGQNYLGRALASPPYKRHLIAVESRHHNVENARFMDVLAKVAEKPKIMRNKKQFRAEVGPEVAAKWKFKDQYRGPEPVMKTDESPSEIQATLQVTPDGSGSVQYVEHRILDGNLEPVVKQIVDEPSIAASVQTAADVPGKTATDFENVHFPINHVRSTTEQKLMVISLHSCGNLLHHGIRSLLLNPSVAAVSLVGCCYNLVTERLGPPTYKLPYLRPNHPRLEQESNAFDPHGFPMSERLGKYQHAQGHGITFNITARMMAVQAPQNWGVDDSEDFFTRHFFRALLQRIFVDYSLLGEGSEPLLIGSLRKSCYKDFVSYVRGAIEKLTKNSDRGSVLEEKLCTLTDDDIRAYEERFLPRRKDLAIIWSLMAFSAGLVEAVIVVDRWLFLREQPEVKDCWVEPVFDYKESPRNLVVVGIKR